MNHTCQDFNAECAQRIGHVDLVIELGSCNVNGSVHASYQAERYIGVDAREGREVDMVADACTWQPDELADVVVCNNTVEHCEHPERLIANAHRMLKDGGCLVLTMPCIGWLPHGNDGATLPDGEYYANVSIEDMTRWLKPWGDSEFSSRDGVVCVTARKGAPSEQDQRRIVVADKVSHVGVGFMTCTDCHCLLRTGDGPTCPACLAQRDEREKVRAKYAKEGKDHVMGIDSFPVEDGRVIGPPEVVDAYSKSPRGAKADEKPAPKAPKTTDEKPA